MRRNSYPPFSALKMCGYVRMCDKKCAISGDKVIEYQLSINWCSDYSD